MKFVGYRRMNNSASSRLDWQSKSFSEDKCMNSSLRSNFEGSYMSFGRGIDTDR